MIFELILAAAVCQAKVPPVAPADLPRAAVIDNSKVIDEQNKRIKALEDTIAELKKAPAFRQTKKFVMADKTGKIYENDNYDQLVYDINMLNKYGTLSPTKTALPSDLQVEQGNCVNGVCTLPNLPQRNYYQPSYSCSPSPGGS